MTSPVLYSQEKLAISLRDVNKQYFLNGKPIEALKNISLDIAEGEFVVIEGQSGAGKTTLLKILGLIEKASSGKVIIGGNDVSKLSERALTLLRRNTVGTVFQHFDLIPSLTAEKNVELPMLLAKLSKKERLNRLNELFKIVGLSHRRSFLPDQLSGGEKQRVSIARALANEPKILLVDEPTGSLDYKTGVRILRLFLNINRLKRQTIVMITHDKNFIEYADRVITIHDGEIVNTRKGAFAGETPQEE